MELRLNSLGGYEPVTYHWPFHFKDQGCEIIEAISFACQEEPPLRKYLDDILSGCVASSYESMKMVCARFNQAVDHLRSLVTSGLYEVERRASVKLLHHVIQTCYNRAVVDPDKLNHYEPFSAEVYGETSFELVHQMIDTIKFSENDQFIDLGSGVGHVVLQVAASTPCKSCFGIEKAHWPALYAKQMSSEFDKWMKFYGKECGPYDLLKGNFLSDDFKDIISNATVIFVNNFAFGPQVDHELKLRFSNLKEGTKIVSSKAFCAMNMQITERNLSDIGAILTVEELSPLRGPVSWTPKRITYYLHTIDRTQLEEYFRMRQKPLKKQKKSLASNGYRISKTQNSNGDIKKIKSTRLWKRNKRPPTISMVSTITAIDSHSVLHCSNVKKALWNDSLNSSSTSPAYIFPSAKIFEETDDTPATGSNGQNANHVQKNLLDDIHPTFRTVKDSSPLKHCFLQSQTTPKMGFESGTPFSPISSKDMFLGFCIEDNELSDELQLEIENIITLFHSETSKISHQDGYKPSNVYNDLTLLEDYSSQNCSKQSETDLISICNNESVVAKSSSQHPNSENDINKMEQAWIQPITPSREMSKFTVSLPRFSPITPDTPNNSFSNNLCTKKCIPFPFLGKANDLFVNTSISGIVNNPSLSKECNREMVSPVVPAINPSSFVTKGADLEKQKFSTPLIRPASRTLSSQFVGHEIQGDDKGPNILEESTLANNLLRPHHFPVTGNQPQIKWDNSRALTVSLPKQILDNSHLSCDDSKIFSFNGIHSDHTNNEHNGDDADPPELLFLMNAFRMQYKNVIKSMKHPSFRSKLMREYELQRDYQESLNKQILKLNSELCELQHKNQILHQQYVQGHSRTESADQHSCQAREFPSVSSSPCTLDQAICLDSMISQDSSQVYQDHFKLSGNGNKKTNNIAIGHCSTSDDIIKIQPSSPEMPLLLPETCSNFIEDEQSIQHSKFTPPPKLTVCISEPKVASFDIPIYCNQSSLCGTESKVNETPRQEICFSPISSCSSESPPQSPNANNFKCSKRIDSSLKNQLADNIYYSLFSNSMQNPCLNAKFESVHAKFPCENTEPLPSFKKRKAQQVLPEHLLRTKRSYVATDLIGQVNENTFDSMILRNVLNSKAPLCTDSRSDSRDSGFGKDSETDSEASNRSKQNNDPKIILHAPVQKQHPILNHCETAQVDYQSLPMASMIGRSTLEGNLKENQHQVLGHGNLQFRHPITQHQAYQFAQYPTLNQDISCFTLNGQISRPASSFELSFSSLANYYEKYLSTDGRTFVHDLNLKDNSSHFNLLRHSYSSAFT